MHKEVHNWLAKKLKNKKLCTYNINQLDIESLIILKTLGNRLLSLRLKKYIVVCCIAQDQNTTSGDKNFKKEGQVWPENTFLNNEK
jgi:hypothetical protein